MFWSFVLPFQITAALLAFVLFATVVLAPLLKWKRAETAGLGVLGLLVLFIPSCVVVDLATGPLRFRTYRYDTYKELTYPRARWYVPAAATDLVVNYRRNGYAAKFKVTQAELDAWFEQAFDTGYDSEFLSTDGKSVRAAAGGDLDRWAVTCAQVDWVRPTDAVIYAGPYEADGGGSTILYDVENEVAYQDCLIW